MASVHSIDQKRVETWKPATQEDHRVIRAQLEKMLQHSLFSHSRRYPAFLRTVVDFACATPLEVLKERALGVQIFDRSPDYDTNTDPIVRVTAAEVRKRVNAYYAGPGCEDEIILTIPYGSYVPCFQRRMAEDDLATVEPDEVKSVATELETRETVAGAWHWISFRRRWTAAGVTAVTLVLLAIVLWPANSVNRFWSPVFAGSRPVLIALAIQPNTPNSAMLFDVSEQERLPVGANAIMVNDAMPLFAISGLFYTHKTPYRIQSARQVTLEDMREGPTIFIGAFDNMWTMREAGNLRFSFQKTPDGAKTWIRDRNDPNRLNWKHNLLTENGHPDSDYGIVARFTDTATGRPTVIIAGLSSYATAAAGEFLTDPELLDLMRLKPGDWEKRNLEAVISTRVIDGKHSRPSVEAIEVW